MFVIVHRFVVTWFLLLSTTTASFSSFIDEHDILSSKRDTPTTLLEPGTSHYRVNCYQSLLQRIKDRRYYDSKEGEGGNRRAFIVEIPLDELVAWDGVRGTQMANRAIQNTTRYLSLFAKVIDGKLESMQAGAGNADGNGNEREGAGLGWGENITIEFPPILMQGTN